MESDNFQNDEERSLLGNNQRVNRHASLTGVPSTILEPPNVYKSRWRSIRIMYLTMFLSSVSFSICMSSIWPYLQVVDPLAGSAFLGWVVAAYSLGQFLASPIFGGWANIQKNSYVPLVVSISINIAANILYAYIEVIPTKRSWVLLAARFAIGFGAGNVAVVRAYVSGATTMKERTPAMANLSAGQAIGFIIGPGIQAAFYPIGYPGIVHIPEVHIDLYTAPALFSAVLGIVNICLILTIFSEHKVQDDDIGGGSIQYSPDTEDLLTVADVDKPDTVAVVASNITFFVVLFVFSLFETISTPVSMDMYDWTKSQATLYNGIILACAGILAVIVFMAIKVVTKKINERVILLGGFCFILAGFIVYLPWGNIYPDYQLTKLVPAIVNNTHQSSTAGPLINGTDVTPVGCPTSQAWCAYIPKISFAQNIVGALCVAIGYPTCNVMSYTIYSKILGPTPQGTMMGWFTASGSLARMVGPIFISYFYSHFGPRVSFVTVCAIILMTILGVTVVYKRLVPFRITRKPLRSYTTN